MTNRTHYKENSPFEDIIDSLKCRIISKGNLQYVSVERQLEIIDQLCEFPLGRFILERKGANGFWTDYMISHPDKGKLTGLNIEGKSFSYLEDFFLNRCPTVVAHQERFHIFQHLIQERLKDNIVLASIPCGVMRDLLTLNLSRINNYHLVGIDIDEESLILAKKLARDRGITNVKFIQQDAWKIEFDEEFDLITSSGLNVYESDMNKVLDLYGKFFMALKPGGALITSLLTYPPGEKVKTDWDIRGISPEDLLLEQIIHKDILEIKWRNFRSSGELATEFEQVGFTEVSIFFDKHHVFPTILAQKLL